MINVLSNQVSSRAVNPIYKKDSPITSDKFKLADSEAIISTLESKGFIHRNTSFGTPRKEERRGYQKHVMVFERDDLQVDSENRFQILITNAHDGTSSLRINLGIYRLVCANGLVIGSTLFERRIRHVGPSFYEELELGIDDIVAQSGTIVKKVKEMKGTTLSYFDKVELVKKMFNVRYPKISPNMVNIGRALEPIRSEDDKQDLFTVFNLIQEKLIRGGLEYYVTRTDKEGAESLVRTHARRLKAVDKITTINKGLWEVAA